jgi:hypothetical protein
MKVGNESSWKVEGTRGAMSPRVVSIRLESIYTDLNYSLKIPFINHSY